MACFAMSAPIRNMKSRQMPPLPRGMPTSQIPLLQMPPPRFPQQKQRKQPAQPYPFPDAADIRKGFGLSFRVQGLVFFLTSVRECNLVSPGA